MGILFIFKVFILGIGYFGIPRQELRAVREKACTVSLPTAETQKVLIDIQMTVPPRIL